jgi:SH3 domain protein
MSRIICLIFFSSLAWATQAQQHYVSDEQFVPLRSGPGTEFRIVHRGIPSGTALTVEEVSEDNKFSRIVTARGTEGWIRSQYLVQQQPARQLLSAATQENDILQKELADALQQQDELLENFQSISDKLVTTEEQLNSTGGELEEVKRISANALSLDEDKKRLLEHGEMQHSRIEVLEAENLRLQDSAESDSFFNGALAVLLGVIITLLVPRLWPKRRNSSSWA